MKRYLYLWHRWLGIGCCLLMVLWSSPAWSCCMSAIPS